MNERIEELWDKAAESTKDDSWQSHTLFMERFAELIVHECVNVVEGGRFLHDQAPTALFAKECSGAIKKHFGLKE